MISPVKPGAEFCAFPDVPDGVVRRCRRSHDRPSAGTVEGCRGEMSPRLCCAWCAWGGGGSGRLVEVVSASWLEMHNCAAGFSVALVLDS